MVEELHLTPRAFKRLVPRIRTKVTGCVSPHCWEVNDPTNVNEKIYLGPKETGRKKGYYASVRRVLFLWEYDMLPMTKIYMTCGNSKCVNPAHARVKNFEKQLSEYIPRQIEELKLYPDDAKEWFGYTPPETAKTGIKAASEQL